MTVTTTDRGARALEALAGPLDEFGGALRATRDALRARLPRGEAPAERLAQLAAELGPFATGRIDLDRFAALFGTQVAPSAPGADGIARAVAALEALLAEGDQLVRLRVAPGGSLYDTVNRGLEHAGAAFAAAREARALLDGSGDAPRGEVGGLAFRHWSRAERRLAPPLVVEVAGADLRAGGLAEFLDGGVKIVLLVDGPSAPAPLARLVAPGVWVLQTADGSDLDRFAAWPGPGIAAWVSADAAVFSHDPAGGLAPWQRIAVASLPEAAPRNPIGGASVAQQVAELQILASLAQRPEGGEAAAPAADGDTAGKLAAWLLRNADLSGLP
ncbi:MAG: hypothetical protein FJZ01_05200 [Candidatus Sericytochromatia bacterium]|nr:hypothetical protein [Candidatus Tanganyikabacteria bacterium]